MAPPNDDDFGSFRPARERQGEPGDVRKSDVRFSDQGPPDRRLLNSRPKTSTVPLAPAAVVPASPVSPDDFIVPNLAERSSAALPTGQSSALPAREAAEPLPRIARTGPARMGPSAVPPPPRLPNTRPNPRPMSAPPYVSAVDDDSDDESETRSIGRIIGFAAIGVIAVFGAAVGAVVVFTPVDLVRERLVREVKAKTGRDLRIGGSPSISFWPKVAVSLGDVALSNPPGMAGPPLVTMARLDATIQLWPLLQRRVQVDQLVLQSPRIVLTVDGQGRRNWDFASLVDPASRGIQVAQAGPLDINALPEELRDFAKGGSLSRAAETAAINGLSLGRVRIVDGVVQHFDERAGQAEEATGIDMTIDAPDLAGPLQAAGTLFWRGEQVRLDTRIMPAKALLSRGQMQATAAIGSGPLHLTYAGTIVPGQATPRFDGLLTAKSPGLAKAAQWLGRPLVGEPANGPMAFKGRVALAGNRVGFTDGALQMPGLALTGALALDTGATRPKLSGQIKLAELNVDAISKLRLLEPVARPVTRQPARPAPVSPATAAQPQSIEDLLKDPAVAPSKQVRGFTRRGGWDETPLDLAVLAATDADLKIAFNRLSGESLNTGPGHVTLALIDRVLKISFDDVALYEGRMRGTLAMDGAAQRPAIAVNLVWDGFALQPLLKDLDAEGLDGKARLTVALNGSGRTERQIIDSLSGKVELLVPRGAIHGFDLAQMVQGLPQGRMPRFEKVAGARTEFTDLGASFVVTKGVADNRDFRIVTRDLRAIGNGQIALGPRTIDATVRPKLSSAVSAPAGVGGPGINLANLDLPIRITGALDKPQISADFSNILRNPGEVVETLKQLDRNGEVQETVKGLVAGDEAAKKKARDFLNNLLKR